MIEFNPGSDRWGDIWSVFVPGIKAGQLYHFQADGPFDPRQGHRFKPEARLIDPYARALAGRFLPGDDGIVRPPKCVVVDDTSIGRATGISSGRSPKRSSTRCTSAASPSSHEQGASIPARTLGVIEKIPYLKSLGVTAVELMPVHEFPTEEADGSKRERVELLGLRPDGVLRAAPRLHGRHKPGDQVRQFKEMVRELHAAGIEVILDVVFNHTAEGNEHGPTFSFKGLENRVYYMLNDDGSYKNYSGCGNTVNGNHPIVREMIFHCLRHWVHNYHIDGFRFDLASILSRNRKGELVPNPPMVELIAEDPMLADTKIIAEAWDAAGAYQVGSFANQRWAEWNGHYRDDIRRYLARRLRHDRPDGHAARRLQRPLPTQRPPAVPQHQLHHVARRLHAQRPGELRAEAQPRQRRGQPRRRQQQLQRELRRRRPDAPQGDRRAPPAAGQEHDGVAAVEPGRADDRLSATKCSARSAATTTPTARTTRSAGSTGGWSRRTPRCCGSCKR